MRSSRSEVSHDGTLYWLEKGKRTPPTEIFFHRRMIAQESGGSIVFIASISAHSVNFPQPQISYNVSKAGVLHLTHSLAAEWVRYGIRVNSISPGYMDTILNSGDGLEVGRKIWTSRNPMGRMGDPEELTGAVVLLCSRVAGYYWGGHRR